MHISIAKAEPLAEASSLSSFDAKIFTASDRLSEADWRELECRWLLVDGAVAGLSAVRRDSGVFETDSYPYRHGVLYIARTGILPEFQGIGLGLVLKAWQIAYAKRHGFLQIVTNCRSSNRRIIALNEKFGFRVTRVISPYYNNPVEGAMVMELVVRQAAF